MSRVRRSAPSRRLNADQAAQRLVTLFDELGFQPEPAWERAGSEPVVSDADALGRADGDDAGSAAVNAVVSAERTIRLRHCPFLELAEESGPLVCGVHLGLIQGALAELGAPLTSVELDAFAEPGACLVRLAAPTPG